MLPQVACCPKVCFAAGKNVVDTCSLKCVTFSFLPGVLQGRRSRAVRRLQTETEELRLSSGLS